jgi:hypothetical protein
VLDHYFLDAIKPKLSSLDQNLESILTSFQNILSNLRLNATATSPTVPPRTSSLKSARLSLDSAGENWFDAESISATPGEEGLITVVEQETESYQQHDESSEDEEDDLAKLRAGAISPLLTMAPKRLRGTKKELYPLGEWRGKVIKRRETLPAQITLPPPSLLAFLRKNVSSSIFEKLISGWQRFQYNCDASNFQ